MKKIISFVICSIMLLSLFAFSVAAAEDCNHLYTTTIVSPTCVEDGYTLYFCSLCGDSYKDYKSGAQAMGHFYGEWYGIEVASCTKEGIEQRDCNRCKSYETKTIGILPHNDKDGDGKCDSCDFVIDDEVTVSPFDWLIAFFAFIRQWFADIFA